MTFMEGWLGKKTLLSNIVVPCLVKTKYSASPQTPHTNCQAWWCRGDLGLLCSHRTWENFSLKTAMTSNLYQNIVETN